MAEILLHVEKVLNISNNIQVLSESLRTQLNGLTSENRPILQPPIEVADLTKQQCAEAMAVVLEGIWNLSCWGCRDPFHWLYTCPYFSTTQLMFFVYRYFCHHVQANPHVSKWYMEKATNRADIDPSAGRKPHARSPVTSRSSTRNQSNLRPVNCINEVQPDCNSEDTFEEDYVPKKA